MIKREEDKDKKWKIIQPEKTREQLEQENKNLQYQAEHDGLTGLYNRIAMERLTDEWLDRWHMGTMMVMDLDYFKQVNDRYGHITGDQVLQKVSYILTKMFPYNSVVGRVGGDEFVVLFQASMEEDEIETKSLQIRQRLQGVQLHEGLFVHLDITVFGTAYRKNDNYRSMFDRVDQQIIRDKQLRSNGKKSPAPEQQTGKSGLVLDMELIAAEMREQPVLRGSFCQDYEAFKVIFRFIERRMRRSGTEAFILLFTLTGEDDDIAALESRDAQMLELGQVIHDGLRLGDVFTQYSSCQYLVMVSDLTRENADYLAERICQTFYDRQGGATQTVLRYSYPLQPTRIMEKDKTE